MLYTINNLADQEGISRTTLRGWIREHQLPTVRIGTRIMIRTEDYEGWLQERQHIEEPPEKFIVPEPFEVTSEIAKKMKRIY